MPFGQLVIGPPGSGKSTYCNGMDQFLSAVGRKTSVVNLDPANDRLPYTCAVDIRDFVRLEEVMDTMGLGPNGGVIYALEQMEQAVEEFVGQIKALGPQEYVLFDCPGQVELFTHHSALSNVFTKLTKELDFRLVVINLVDSQYLSSPSQYISVLLLSLRSMLQMNLPHLNVISKIDLVSNYAATMPFPLDFYTEVQDLEHLLPYVEKESPSLLGKKYAALTKAIAEVVEDFALVSFEVLSVENKNSMISLLRVIDKASGYQFGTTEIGGDTVWIEATRNSKPAYLADVSIHERWIEHKNEYDDEEERQEIERAKEKSEGVKDKKDMTAEEEWQAALDDWNEQKNQAGSDSFGR